MNSPNFVIDVDEETLAHSTYVVVEDHAVVRAGVVLQLQPERWLNLVGEAGDAEDAFRLINERRPDLALCDLRLPGATGVDLARRVADHKLPTRVVLFSAFTDALLVRRAFNAGAWAFVDKTSPPHVLVAAMREARLGRRYVDPALAASVVGEAGPELSPREHEVLKYMADGMSNQQVADELGLNVETVKTHVKRILAKLDADSRTQAVAVALRRSLIV